MNPQLKGKNTTPIGALIINNYWYSNKFWREVFIIIGLFLPVPVAYPDFKLFTIGKHDFTVTIGVGRFSMPIGLIILIVIKLLGI